MIKFFILFSLFTSILGAESAQVNDSKRFTLINTNYLNKVVSAIYVIEGGAKTKYPWGIKSIKTNNPKLACEQTVANNWIRYNNLKEDKNKYHCYLDFLASRYCPISCDPVGHKNWVNNIHKLVK